MTLKQQPLRVLHLHGDLVAGGGQTLSREWLRASDRSEIDPYAVVLNPPVTLQVSFEQAGIKVSRIFGSRPLQIFQLVKYIRQNKIDIIHTQSEQDRKIGHWAALLTRKPVIAHLHSEWVYFEKPSQDKTGILSKIRAHAVFVLRKISERSVVHFVATSDLVADAFRPYTKKPITTVEPGVAVTSLTKEQRKKYREALRIKPDEFVIVNLSRLDPVKNLEDFIETIALLAPQINVRGLVAGEGPLRDKLQQLVSEKGLYREVQILNALDDPLDLVGAADVFLATSTYESFGISVLEALSAGTPVVGYNLGVYQRYNGAVRSTEVGNVEGLAEICMQLAVDTSEQETAREKAIEAAHKYNIIKGTKVLIELDHKYVPVNKEGRI